MCGIAGYIGDTSSSSLRAMLFSMRHRGYDEEVSYHNKDIHIGMNRLAIVDPSKGLYPMQYKQLKLVYNGEIYNHQYLRRLLESRGVKFFSSCDAEVILPLYDTYGTDAFSMLEGMFAICIFDIKNNVYTLARDKTGEKPLYFFHKGSSFVFASELRTLLHHSFIKKHINAKTFEDYLKYGYSVGKNTIIDGIKKVEPSHFLQYHCKTHTLLYRKYWQLDVTQHLDYSHTVDLLDEMLRNAVQIRMPPGKVGCFLSGGIDSSLIARYISEKRSRCYTFSVSFPEYIIHDESRYSRYIASLLGTRHTVIDCTVNDMRQLMASIGSLVDEPTSDPAFFPTFLLAKEARKKVKVILSGEGADELFGGYEHYLKVYYTKNLKKILHVLPRPYAKFLEKHVPKGMLLPWQDLYERYMRVISDKQMTFLTNKKFSFSSSPFSFSDNQQKNDLYKTLERDFRYYLPSQLLMKVDKSAMLANLETRCPFLDSSVISYAFALSDNWKIRNGQTKYILRKVAAKYYPHQFVSRRKHGFSLPLRDWFSKELYPVLKESVPIMSEYAPSLDCVYYKKLLVEHYERIDDHSSVIWSIYVMIKWLEHNNIRI